MEFLSELAKKFVYYALCLLCLLAFLLCVAISYAVILMNIPRMNIITLFTVPPAIYFVAIYTVCNGKVLENIGNLRLEDFLKRTGTAFLFSLVVAAISRAFVKAPIEPMLLGGFSFYCAMYLFYLQKPSGGTVRPGQTVRGVTEVKQPRLPKNPVKPSEPGVQQPGQATQLSPEEIERRLGKDL